ncbi:hypothetical protein GYMLUDRAFT_46315 [Collybiopsis luxurians FD-317 M1]|uniref:Uncharacterized protein n=1 Tax=Collybiopsis luxurians FD-317 M1 TaxID=944289 RepID=A0A0D0C4V2_9AGAR|nr:hypothetical protein GYMLUDRAFT_46315 [Collybiopsis luxurians FD-317 M1]
MRYPDIQVDFQGNIGVVLGCTSRSSSERSRRESCRCTGSAKRFMFRVIETNLVCIRNT